MDRYGSPRPTKPVGTGQVAMTSAFEFPDGRRFAFTILDDTDDATVENVKPVYDLLQRLGMRTTKTVWPLDSPTESKGHYHRGETLEDPGYRAWIVELARAGFEIAFHNASMTSSTRERTLEGLQALRELLGHSPRLHCNHGQNEENLYWGAARYASGLQHFTPLLRPFLRGPRRYAGDVEGSPYFWGDVAHETFDYVRSFAFRRVDCSEIPPGRPYLDVAKPWVRCWFNTADAPTVREFVRLLTPGRIERLRDRGGWCVLSTHLGKGFATNGRLDSQVEDILSAIAAEPGWFVPTSELLDHLVSAHPPQPLGERDRARLEYGHLVDRLLDRVDYR